MEIKYLITYRKKINKNVHFIGLVNSVDTNIGLNLRKIKSLFDFLGSLDILSW